MDHLSSRRVKVRRSLERCWCVGINGKGFRVLVCLFHRLDVLVEPISKCYCSRRFVVVAAAAAIAAAVVAAVGGDRAVVVIVAVVGVVVRRNKRISVTELAPHRDTRIASLDSS